MVIAGIADSGARALRAGVPVLATRHAGIPEIITDGGSLLVDERDPTALAAAILRHYEMGDAAQSLVSAGQKRLRAGFDSAAVKPTAAILLAPWRTCPKAEQMALPKPSCT